MTPRRAQARASFSQLNAACSVPCAFFTLQLHLQQSDCHRGCDALYSRRVIPYREDVVKLCSKLCTNCNALHCKRVLPSMVHV